MSIYRCITCVKAFQGSDVHVGVLHVKSVLAFEFLLRQRKEHNYFELLYFFKKLTQIYFIDRFLNRPDYCKVIIINMFIIFY